ncbi:MAG: long-chain fatty acid--CoA ligase [Deltaproteobacteria bacterium]|nr:MAG: long-chain fatty acid--CoA ligase [Deltaproteobacteria bacterium]
MNLMMLLEMAASGFGERAAVTNGAQTLTYSELFRAAGAAISRAAMLDVSSLALPIGLFGSAWAGVPFAPLNYRLTRSELEALVARITPCYLIAASDRVEELTGLPETTVVPRERFLERTRNPADADSGWPMDPDEIAVLLFTSGTTGAPKAAVLRHKHLVSYILGSVEFGSAPEAAAGLVSVPPYHIAGIAAIASSVYAGRRIVQLPNFSAEAWLELARAERVTHAFVVPTMLARIVEAIGDARSADLPQLQALSYGGGKMPQPVIERAMQLFPGVAFSNAYGLTETSSTLAILGPDDHRTAAASDDPKIRRRLTSVGRALPSVEVQIRDESGNRLGPDERGEIYVRGEQVSGEYLGRGASLDADGWFPTRDAGSMDAEGYLFIEGRADDVIVRGGENMSPGEIEDVLLEHEAVADSAVVGIPDEQWGEAVAAVVVTRPGCSVTEPELQAWVQARLRSSRTPQRIEFRDALPYNETGKLLRRLVRAELLGETP